MWTGNMGTGGLTVAARAERLGVQQQHLGSGPLESVPRASGPTGLLGRGWPAISHPFGPLLFPLPSI